MELLDARHQLAGEPAEPDIVRRDGADGTTLQELGKNPASANLSLLGVRAVEDLIEKKQHRLALRRRVEHPLQTRYLCVEVADAPSERIAYLLARSNDQGRQNEPAPTDPSPREGEHP